MTIINTLKGPTIPGSTMVMFSSHVFGVAGSNLCVRSNKLYLDKRTRLCLIGLWEFHCLKLNISDPISKFCFWLIPTIKTIRNDKRLLVVLVIVITEVPYFAGRSVSERAGSSRTVMCPEERDWPVIRRAVIASINTSNSAAEGRFIVQYCSSGLAANTPPQSVLPLPNKPSTVSIHNYTIIYCITNLSYICEHKES